MVSFPTTLWVVTPKSVKEERMKEECFSHKHLNYFYMLELYGNRRNNWGKLPPRCKKKVKKTPEKYDSVPEK